MKKNVANHSTIATVVITWHDYM